MNAWMMRAAAAAIAVLVGPTALLAQEAQNAGVCDATDGLWTVCVAPEPKECWAISKPQETVNTRDGQPVSVNRGTIELYVTYRSGEAGVLSFWGGYPFAEGSTVTLDVDGTSFDLFIDGEWAWPAPEQDSAILEALKKGGSALLTGRSSRGTKTEDRFSLRGFTAAVDEAAKRCQ